MIKTPTILQMEASECGAVALAIILGYHECYVSLEKLRAQCGVSRDGSKAVNMLKVARQYGFDARGLQIEALNDLKHVKLPYILYWEFNHFVVLNGIKGNTYYINDPATGPRTVSKDDFDKSFTGVALVFQPTNKFVKRGKKPSAIKTLFKRLKGSHLPLIYIILASLALVIPGVIIPGFSKIFIDDILIRHVESWFTPLLVGMLITAVMRGTLSWLQQTYLLRLQIKLMLTGSARFLWHVLSLPITFFQQRFTGDVQERVAANNRVAELLSSNLTSSVVSLITMVFYGLILALLEWKLALIVITFSGISFLILYLVARKISDISRRFLQERGRLTGVEMNGLQIIETIKAMGLEDDFFKRWAGYHAKTINSQQKIMTYNQALLILPQLLSGLTTVAILSFGGWQVMQGVLTVGTLVAFQSLTVSFNSPLISLLGLGNQIQQIRGDLARLDDVLRHPTDPRLIVEEEHEAKVKKLNGSVQLKNVTFGYSSQEPPFLKNINITVRPGEHIAIVGASGSGKSTLIRLICGLFQPWTGEVKIDNTPLTMISQAQLAETLSLVDQDIFLFKGTVLNNLTMWHTQHNNEAVESALKDACLMDTIIERGGLFTEVAEAGNNFSGGQRQRLEIARALVTQPNLLILDEATALLDPITEKHIYTNLKQQNCSLIIVAHRLSTIRDCDNIIVLNEGEIVEQGTHDVLLKQNGRYRALIDTVGDLD